MPKEYFTIDKPNGRRLTIGPDEFKGKRYLAIKELYQDNITGEYKPRACITVPPEIIKEFINSISGLNVDEVIKDVNET